MRYRVLNSLATDEIELPKYQVPDTLTDDGFYFIEVTQVQMYDLGNLGQVVHYILYDRRLKIAVDITSDVCGAPLLSRTPPVEPITEKSISVIEKFLTAELNENHLEADEKAGVKSFPSMSAFRARELDASRRPEIRSHIDIKVVTVTSFLILKIGKGVTVTIFFTTHTENPECSWERIWETTPSSISSALWSPKSTTEENFWYGREDGWLSTPATAHCHFDYKAHVTMDEPLH